MKSVYFALAGLVLAASCGPSASNRAALAADRALTLAETAELGDAVWLDARKLAEEAVAADETQRIVMAGVIGRSLVLGPDNQTRAGDGEAYLLEGLPADVKLNWILAKGYDNGWYGEVDKPRACGHYSAAAKDAHLNAAYWPLALCYLSGTGVARDEEAAFEWMEKSANAGDQSGMVSLAVLYATGQGTQKNLDRAATWYETAIRTAGSNRAQALRGLGAMHLFELEDGIRQRGYALLELAKTGGDPIAERLLLSVGALNPEQRQAVDVQKEFLTNFYKLKRDPTSQAG